MARRGVLILLLLQAAAFWPMWGWAASRVREGDADEIVALVAAAAALFITPRSARLGRGVARPNARRECAVLAAPTSSVAVSSLVLPTLLMFGYAAAAASSAPPLLHAMIASCALLATWCVWRWNARPHPAALGLALLALPAMPTAQFVLGFPLRAAAGEIAARLLRLCGLAVVREGVSLRLGERLVAIDAPCSGVNMLWMAVLLALVLAALGGASTLRTTSLVTMAALLAVAGNALRAASLFFTESGILALPAGVRGESVHGALGVVAFAIAAGPVVWMALRWSPAERRTAWRAAPSREAA
jgi:exosortase/archaeosortase family protein